MGQCRNPLIGPNDPIGERFISMLDAYDPAIRAAVTNSLRTHARKGMETVVARRRCLVDRQAHKHADDNDITLHDGTYLAVLGPSFETPAEIKALPHPHPPQPPRPCT